MSSNGKHAQQYARRLGEALEMIDAGFTSKSAKKAANDMLNRAYDDLREMHGNDYREIGFRDYPVDADRWDYFESMELPFGLHQYRPAKHDSRCPEYAEQINALVALREDVKAAEIGVKAESEKTIIRKAEKAAAADVVDNGFRTSFGIHSMPVSCYLSATGTTYTRVIWYRSGSVTAFQAIMAEVGEQAAKWNKAGRPNMAEWSVDKIRAFYSEAA